MRPVIAILVATACCALAADQVFEVASIHTRTDSSGDVWTVKPFRFDFSGPNLLIENFRLVDLITFAYDIKDYELAGEPHWADIDRYNISAKAAEGVSLTPDAARPMMQALLSERFQLTVHTETKDMPVYSLVVAKDGPKFKKSALGTEKLLTLESKGKTNLITVTGGNMEQLIAEFSKRNGVDRPVIDRTGLSGNYNYRLEWGDDLGTDAGVLSIFAAFQQQLGLRLEPKRASVHVLIVDHAEKPSAN
ncbi:MAG: TIGR03435 family protein [Acidobacteriia bacterium]|nr:TIGR03435 family protein [Terriglobia bacterium]